ncbi:Nramp family divalent metal transporter [Candidatus Microgenomates bacterium]|nr:Nramp family divalent metal transporter [Candidatus Microgenomates bacterium]
MHKIKKFLKSLGPGIITGAADDDPSGIATYAIAGAQFGYGLLWTALFSFPLMTAVQEICGRIGLVTKKGLAEVVKEHYPRPLLWLVSLLLLAANIFNIGADLAGMAAAIKLFVPINDLVISLAVAVTIVILTIKLTYPQIALVFKWLTVALFTYVATFFLTNQSWTEIAKGTFVPMLGNKDYLLLILAIFGTTISPYLFFWQASEEAEEEKLKRHLVTKNELKSEGEDTLSGMLFSNLIMYFIIATTAATLFRAGITNISSAAEAASALRPLAGDFAALFFALGIVGTGVLTIPILAGSAAYALSETLGFKEGLNKPFRKAEGFYIVIALAVLLGFLLNLIGLNPFKYLFYSAVLNGLVSPILIAMLLLIANNKKIMGDFTNRPVSNILTGATLLLMTLAAVAIFVVH